MTKATEASMEKGNPGSRRGRGSTNSCFQSSSALILNSLMRRSIQNFNIPPRAYPGHLTVHRARGGGNLNVAFEGWGI